MKEYLGSGARMSSKMLGSGSSSGSNSISIGSIVGGGWGILGFADGAGRMRQASSLSLTHFLSSVASITDAVSPAYRIIASTFSSYSLSYI